MPTPGRQLKTRKEKKKRKKNKKKKKTKNGENDDAAAVRKPAAQRCLKKLPGPTFGT